MASSLRIISTGRFRPDALFRPESVAVIGADGAEGAHVMTNLLAGGFKGAILPVVPGQKGHTAINGVLAYPDVASLPIAPDLAVVCGEDLIAESFAELAKRGTHAAVVTGMASGLRDLARRVGVRSLGPGSFGIAVPSIGLNASRSHLVPRAGKIALVSQSAALCRAVLDWAEPNGVGFSHVVGIGGNGDIGFGLVLDWLARDGGTGAILLDIRKIKDARIFLSAARAAARLRPVVAIRAGSLLMDPTGQADAAFNAALHRSGVLVVSSIGDFLAAAETLTRAKPPRRDTLAIVTNAIGPAQLAADAALRDGLKLAELSAETRAAVTKAFPNALAPKPEATAGAPAVTQDIIYVGLDEPMRLAEAATLLAGAPEVGGVIVVHAPSGSEDGPAIEAMTGVASKIRVPLLVAAMGETTGQKHRRVLTQAGVPTFEVPGHAVRGFMHLVQDRASRAAARELPPSKVLNLAPDLAEVRRVFRRARVQGRLMLTQDEAMGVLAAYGVPTVPCRPAATQEDAAHAANLLGYPVVLKRRRMERPDPLSKGGLVLDLRDAEQVLGAARVLDMRDQLDNGQEPGFLVQRQVGRSRELLVRVAQDALFGPIIIFGQGGTTAELLYSMGLGAGMGDRAVDLPPLNLPLAHGLIGRTRVAAALGQLHDLPAANVDAVADALVRVSQLVVDFPEIAELDVNPLFADAQGVTAADAWIALREEGAPPGRLALPPYPEEWVGTYTAKGETLQVRPIRPEDAEAHGAFFKRLAPEDVRYRFFSALRELSAEQISRMTQVDYDREIAFVAVREETRETVGVSRLVRDVMGPDSGAEGEFAVIVQGDMKGRGLARHLMQRLIDWGAAQGMKAITGQVLADNAPMLGFMRSMGFTIHRLPQEDDVVECRREIEPAPVGGDAPAA